MSEPYCGTWVISGVECHGVIQDGTITLHDLKPGVNWDRDENISWDQAF